MIESTISKQRKESNGMAKKMVNVGGGDGIVKKRIMKRPKKKTIHKVIDYLLSDCYLFAPLVSPSPYNSNSRAPSNKGIEIRERTKDHRSLVKKIEDYLKSDCHMYASLVEPQSLRARGCVGYVKKVSTEVSSRSSLRRSGASVMTKEKRICTTDFVEARVLDVDQPNATPKESLNCPSLSTSGEGMRDPKMRKIIAGETSA